MRKLSSSLLLAALVAAPLLQGCVAVAAGAVGGVLFKDTVFADEVYTGFIDVDANRAWSTVKTSLNNASLKPIDVDDDTRKAEAEIDGARVTVTVETYDLNRSTFRVSAKKYGVSNGEIAKSVFDRIVAELNNNR